MFSLQTFVLPDLLSLSSFSVPRLLKIFHRLMDIASVSSKWSFPTSWLAESCHGTALERPLQRQNCCGYLNSVQSTGWKTVPEAVKRMLEACIQFSDPCKYAQRGSEEPIKLSENNMRLSQIVYLNDRVRFGFHNLRLASRLKISLPNQDTLEILLLHHVKFRNQTAGPILAPGVAK